MKKLSIGDVTIISIIERDGPWRTPQEMFPISANAISPSLTPSRLRWQPARRTKHGGDNALPPWVDY
jgi:hypothetical protein